MAEKVTEMKLRVIVDLQCPCCYKKVKKILCKFPQIKDQVYDEKNSIVKITVVCCSPEKIRDKLCCKGGKVIKSIEIVEPPPPPPPPPPPTPSPSPPPRLSHPPTPPSPRQVPPPRPPSPTPDPTPRQVLLAAPPSPKPDPTPRSPVCCPECYEGHSGGPCYLQPLRLPPPTPKPLLPPALAAPKPDTVPWPPACCPECYERHPGGPCNQWYGRPVPPPSPPLPTPIPILPPAPPAPKPDPTPRHPVCCTECYEGHSGGPCYQWYGRPMPPPPCYEFHGYLYSRRCNVSRGDYFNEENPSACSIM